MLHMINGKETRGYRNLVDWAGMRSNMFGRHRVVYSVPWGMEPRTLRLRELGVHCALFVV